MGDNHTNQFTQERRAQLAAGLRIRKDTYNEIQALLRQAEADIKAKLATAPTDYESFYLPKLQREIKATMQRMAQVAAQRLERGADDSWQAGIDLVDKPIAAGGVQISGMLPRISTTQLTAMRTFMVDRIKDVPVALANKISSQLGQAMIGAQNIGDTVSNIERLFKKQGRSRALTIVRTELGKAYGVATQERMTQAGKHLPGLKKQWRRSGKIHSRLHHDSIDGQIRNVDEPFTLGNDVKLMHPRDPAAPVGEIINCGCESLPWMEHWEVKHPGKKPFSDLEKQLNPVKASMASAQALPTAKLATPKRQMNLNTFERRYGRGSVERALVLDRHGNVLDEMMGGAESVRVVKSKLKGATVIHNHPRGSSFSLQDIRTASVNRVAEMRLVDPTYRYTMRPPKGGWSPNVWRTRIRPAALKAEAKYVGQVIDQVLRGEITETQGDYLLYHYVWSEVAKMTGIKYTRRKL